VENKRNLRGVGGGANVKERKEKGLELLLCG